MTAKQLHRQQHSKAAPRPARYAIHKSQSGGLRTTELREALLGILRENADFQFSLDIHKALYDRGVRVSLTSVYRNLEVLCAQHLAKKRSFDGRRNLFAAMEFEGPDHIIEAETGRVVDIHCDRLTLLKQELAEYYGFDADNCHVEIHVQDMVPPQTNSADS